MEATLFFNKNKETTEEIDPEEISETNRYISYLQEIENELRDTIDEGNTLNIDVNKNNNITTVILTRKDGTQKTVQILDGEKGDKGDTGEKGDKGDKGDKPTKGVDYFTPEDIQAMVDEVTEDSESEFNRYARQVTEENIQDIDEFSQDVKTDISDMASALTFATFDVDPVTGHLSMNTTQSLGNMVFSLNINGHLVVSI